MSSVGDGLTGPVDAAVEGGADGQAGLDHGANASKVGRARSASRRSARSIAPSLCVQCTLPRRPLGIQWQMWTDLAGVSTPAFGISARERGSTGVEVRRRLQRFAGAYRSGRAVGAMALGNSVSPINQESTPDAQERPSAIAQTIRL